MKLSTYESEQVTAIEAWKNEEPSVVSQAVGTLLKPVSWLMEKIVPEKAIEGALTLSNSAAEWLTDADDILRDGNVSSIEELRTKSLELSDELANTVHNWAIGVAGAEGGAAVGAAMNIAMLNDVGWAARRAFQERWLVDNGKLTIAED